MDPLAEKYMNISPYAYVANNPVIFIDPDGRKIINPRKMVLSNRTLMNQMKKFDQAVSKISGQKINSFSFTVSGGDRYKKNGKIYSATNDKAIENSAKNSTHLQENGALGVDLVLSQGDISYDVMKQAAEDIGMRIDPSGPYKDGHIHLDIKGYEGEIEYENSRYKPTDADFEHSETPSTQKADKFNKIFQRFNKTLEDFNKKLEDFIQRQEERESQRNQ